MIPKTLLILADDLTGAADTAARCHRIDLPATVFLATPNELPKAGIVALTSDSRHLSPAAAAQRVHDTITPLCDLPNIRWYKKIDSTLRGNIGSELDALLTALESNQTAAQDAPCVIVCPAFPAQGRGLQDGYLVHADTAPRSVHLPTVLAQQSSREIGHIQLGDVRTGLSQLVGELRQQHAQGKHLLVVDAQTEDDLRAQARAALEALPNVIFCGSAGLAGTLVAEIGHTFGDAQTGQSTPSQLESQFSRTLAIIGSGSLMAQRQIAYVRQQGKIAVLQIDANMSLAAIQQHLQAAPNRPWLLHLPPPAQDAKLDGPHARQLAQRLANVAQQAIETLTPNRLFLSGGDTAIHVLGAYGVTKLTVLSELLPGIPLMQTRLMPDRTVTVILKGGSFGDEQTLAQLISPNDAAPTAHGG